MTWTELNSTLENKIKIGGRAIVASGASVIHDVLTATLWFVFPPGPSGIR